MSISARHLKCFISVADCRNITKASAELNITQPALSQALSALESMVGIRLFDRNRRGVILTDAGREFLPAATRILRELERSVGDLRSLSKLEKGEVSVAGLPSMTCSLLPDAISTFAGLFPGVQVTLKDSLAGSVEAMVRQGICEIGLTCLIGKNEYLRSEKLLDDHLVLLCRKDDPLAKKEVITWPDIAREDFIKLSSNSTVGILTEHAFARERLSVDSSHEVSHLSTVGAMVSKGLGITVVAKLSAPLALALAKNTVLKEIEGETVSRPVHLIRSSERSLSPAAVEFWAHLKKCAAKQKMPEK